MSRPVLHSLPERAWFHWNQDVLLKMAQTYYGRELLCLNEGLTDILKIVPNSVISEKNGKSLTELRTHNKYTKVINHRAKEFADYKTFIQKDMWRKAALGNLKLGLPLPVAGGAVTTLYPDADPESNSVDGYCDHVAVGSTFTALVNGAGTFAAPSAASAHAALILVDAGDATNEYTIIRRAFILFDDTANAIPDTDTVDSARIRFWVDAVSNQLSGATHDNSRIVAVSSAPASATNLVAGDYNSQGSTNFGESNTQTNLTTAAYNDITLNASGLSNIDITGLSQFALQYKWDFGDTTTGLTWTAGEVNQSVGMLFAETTGTANDPILEVTHSSTVTRRVMVIS